MPYSRGRTNLMGGRGRGKRGYKRRALNQFPITPKGCRARVVLQTPPTPTPTKTLGVALLTNIPRGGGALDIDREQSDIYLKGFRLRMTVRNGEEIPIFFHLALLQPKDPYPNASSNSNLPFSNEYFFSNPGTIDQTGTTPSSALSGLDWGTRPINGSRHTVIWHYRKSLGVRFQTATQAFTTGAGIPNYAKCSRYIKINKKLQYADGNGTSCRQPIFLVWWASQWEEPAAGEPRAGVLIPEFNVITYFRDTAR